ncbi:MAG TPA: alanine racemase [Acidimicrobiales bacterium]|nr:alanine racemase [Acidimicrobiales bacterium]
MSARVRARLEAVRARMAAWGSDPARVRVVAVTKTFGPPAVRAAAAAGLEHCGENYVEELCATRAATSDLALTWHYLGALQGNKIARIAACADLVASLSRVREVERLARVRPNAAVYVQLDVTGRPERLGAPEAAVPDLVARARDAGLDVRGLMVVAPPDPAGARAAFATTARLADALGLAERSMGMSEDLEWACRAGTTEVRLGRALFGPRGHGAGLA